MLLDPERRAAYDAELGIAPAADAAAEATPADEADEAVTVARVDGRSPRPGAGEARRRRPARCRRCPAG